MQILWVRTGKQYYFHGVAASQYKNTQTVREGRESETDVAQRSQLSRVTFDPALHPM